MSTTPTTNLNLIKNNADEPIANWRTNDNLNMDTLDVAIKAVRDATDTLEKARQNLNNLIGTLGKDSSDADLISKAQARTNLDVPQSDGATKSLYADEQTIAQNASLIASLQNSVSRYVGGASGDYNSYTTQGWYVIGNTMTANKPEESSSLSGILIVHSNTDKSTAVQQYFASNGKAFFREYGSGSGWSPWNYLKEYDTVKYLGKVTTGTVTLTPAQEKDVSIAIPSGTMMMAIHKNQWCSVQNVTISRTNATVRLGGIVNTQMAAAEFYCFKTF